MPPSRFTAGRVAALAGGSIAGLAAFALLAAGGVLLWGNSRKDDAGYLSTSSHRFATGSYAVATDNLDINIDAPGFIVSRDHYGKLRLQVDSRTAAPVFVGVAPTRAVSSYLAASAHTSVTNIDSSPFKVTYADHPGTAKPERPADQTFWAASAHGAGTQTLTWKVRSGDWSIVVMNADASRGVDAGVSAGANVPFLRAVAWGTLGGGVLFLLVAGGLIYVGARSRAHG